MTAPATLPPDVLRLLVAANSLYLDLEETGENRHPETGVEYQTSAALRDALEPFRHILERIDS